ncbi:MAG: hypothetical protein JNM50_13775 [Chromatiales bacterium]|nr:hypothetical protein [Chromatiales bacterium]
MLPSSAQNLGVIPMSALASQLELDAPSQGCELESAASADGPPTVDGVAPMATARQFIAAHFSHIDGRTLHFWRGNYYAWTGSYYRQMESDAVRARLYAWLEHRCSPTKRTVDFVLDALRGVAYLDAQAPCWLGPVRVAGEIIPMANGLLRVESRELYPPTPSYFCLHAAPFPYVADAPAPIAWADFLASVWGDDPSAIDCLQEIIGLLLTDDTSYQKIILIIGPKRSGKGTIARLLRHLLGTDNVTATSLAGLGQTFGLASLIGKPLAIISDARLSGRSDLAVVAENLLRISGEDALPVPRKFQPDWVGTLPTRFLMLTNEIPALTDASGALASRFLILPMTKTFYGREDKTLDNRLAQERPGIFRWALDGLDRLRQRGYLVQPVSGDDVQEQLDRLSSPIKSFVADECVIEPVAEIPCKNLFAAWQTWCQSQHREQTGNLQMFGRNLSAAFPGIAVRRPRRGEARNRVYAGVRLRRFNEEASGPRWSATQSIARDARDIPDRGRDVDIGGHNSPDRGPLRTTVDDLIQQAAQAAGIDPVILHQTLTPADLADPQMMTLDWLTQFAGGLRSSDISVRDGVSHG